MRGLLVAIDLETTGLDARTDQIIEVGAAKFQDGEMIETYTTLVDPGVPLSPRITEITGIKSTDLYGAPKIVEVLPRLIRFVGDAPLVGHNVDFDLRFLHKQKVLLANPAIDTYELAAVLLPTAARYNLNALMQLMNIEPEGAYHRALTDAIADGRLYFAFWQKLLKELPIGVLREIASLAAPLPWKGTLAFQAAAAVREGERPAAQDVVAKAFSTPAPAPQALTPSDTVIPDIETLSLNLAFALPEDTPPADFDSQAWMLRAVTGAYQGNGKVLIEADAGNPAAYLLPAVAWARRGVRTLIAVGTKRRRRDLLAPHGGIAAALKALNAEDIRVAAIRPRGEYLCPAQVNQMRAHGATTNDELRLLAKTLVYLALGGRAAEEELSVRGLSEVLAWTQLNAGGCTGERCESLMKGVCPLHRDRQAAQGAHLLITDHKTLAADKANTDPLIPPAPRLIVDEARLFEDNGTDALRFRLDAQKIKREMLTLGRRDRGLLGAILTIGEGTLPEKTFSGLANGIGNLADASADMLHQMDILFAAIRHFLENTADARPNEFSAQVILTNGLRGKAPYSAVNAAWETLGEYMKALTDVLPSLVGRLRTLHEKHILPRFIEIAAGLERLITMIDTYHRWLESFIVGRDTNAIYWAEIMPGSERPGMLLHSAPLSLAALFTRHIAANTETTILTDTRLRVGGEISYLQKRLGVLDFDLQTIPSPAAAAPTILLYTPSDIAESKQADAYQKQIAKGIIELAAGVPGRILVMFTGVTQLRQTSQAVAPRLALGNIPLLNQADGTQQSSLIEQFRSVDRAVLLATRWLWEDADLPPDEIAALIIIRLPFAPPGEPIIAARGDTYGHEAMVDYTIPHAVLRFRGDCDGFLQGRRGRGVLAVFDKRLITKEYGSAFVDSLPPARAVSGALAELPEKARLWLAGEAV
ncbi:MAG TPA: exonuclease domain-containing protein [Aggregatilineales bacterium]|nr:hypothetical protein [Anaerolineales bacterium]HRE47019.1 exonuclease domain-containing protein [Aggregatilineales bacterium]